MNKSKLSVSFPCTCGHAKKVHDWAGPTIGDEWCDGNGTYIVNHRKNTKYCECLCYTPDNLKYLEQRQKEIRKKGKAK